MQGPQRTSDALEPGLHKILEQNKLNLGPQEQQVVLTAKPPLQSQELHSRCFP